LRLDLTDSTAMAAWLGFNDDAVPQWSGTDPLPRAATEVPVGGIFDPISNPTTTPTVSTVTDLCAAGWDGEGELRLCLIGGTSNNYADPVDWSGTDNFQTYYCAFVPALNAPW